MDRSDFYFGVGGVACAVAAAAPTLVGALIAGAIGALLLRCAWVWDRREREWAEADIDLAEDPEAQA